MAHTIGFGFKVGRTDEVLSFTDQGAFLDEAVTAVERAGGEVIFVGTGNGKYQPTDGGHVVDEPGACVVFNADRFVRWEALYDDLATLACRFHQEAIAVTRGSTRFVNRDGSVEYID